MLNFQIHTTIWRKKKPFIKLCIIAVSIVVEIRLDLLIICYCKIKLLIHNHWYSLFHLKTVCKFLGEVGLPVLSLTFFFFSFGENENGMLNNTRILNVAETCVDCLIHLQGYDFDYNSQTR